MPDEIRILGINGIPLLKKGDDIAKAILDAAEKQGTPVVEDDVLVVTQKIVSKVEGRVYRLSEIQPSILAKRLGRKLDKDPAIVELVLRESRAIERALRGPAVQAALLAQPEEVRERFVLARRELSALVARLATAELAALTAKLDELAPELSKGIAEVGVKMDQLERPVPLLRALGGLLGLLARVAVFAR